MRKYLILLAIGAIALVAEDQKLAVPPDTVVATVNGRKMTADEVRKMVSGLPAQVQNAFTNDPHQFMKEYAWYQVQQASALKHGLNQSHHPLEFQTSLFFQGTFVFSPARALARSPVGPDTRRTLS